MEELLHLSTGTQVTPLARTGVVNSTQVTALTTMYLASLLSLPGKETQAFDLLAREAFVQWPDLQVTLIISPISSPSFLDAGALAQPRGAAASLLSPQ